MSRCHPSRLLSAPPESLWEALGVWAKLSASYEMQVCVVLALQGVPPEIGKEPKTVGAEFMAYLQCSLSNFSNEPVPHLLLGHVFFRHYQKHNRRPSQSVIDNDNLIVLVSNGSGLFARNDITKNAVRPHLHWKILAFS